jgi:hypothetical protein
MGTFYVRHAGADSLASVFLMGYLWTNDNEGDIMNDIRLTTRGKIILVAAILATVYGLFIAVTPEECNVPTENMSQGCISLLYP